MKTLIPLAMGIILWPFFVTAQTVWPVRCTSDHRGTIAALENEYGETLRSLGIMGNGWVLEVVRSDKSWSILATSPDGAVCMIAAGDDWQDIRPGKKGVDG